jgi:chorismate mutase
MNGSTFNDLFYFDSKNNKFHTHSNHAGGVLGGISNGEDLIMRVAVKPPSSISKEQETVDRDGQPAKISIGGRHDPCICPRIVPVAEAMVALVLIDLILVQDRLSASEDIQQIREKINLLDTQLLLLLAQRRNLIQQIALLNKKSNHPVVNEKREKQIMDQWMKLSKHLEIPEELARKIIQEILQDSHRIQESRK